MCIDMQDFKELVKTVDGMKQVLNEVKNDGKNSLKQLEIINGRVGRAEKKIQGLELSRASRADKCPFKDEIKENSNHVLTSNAVRKEMRWWFVSGTGSIIAAIYFFMHIFG